MARYVLVKYAVRGVAQDGRLSPLFSHLYALCAAIPMLCNLLWSLAGLIVGWGAAYAQITYFFYEPKVQKPSAYD